VKNPDVDIVYVATPHSHHYQNCRLAFDHGKAVLCEKALTVNAEQTKTLYKIAKEKNLFFMEAVWTRYFPLSVTVRDWIQKGEIGEVSKVHADLSMRQPADLDLSHRLVNKDLAGGGLLDIGIYALTWVFQTIYHTRPADQRQAPKVVGTAMTPHSKTGVDEATTILLEFPQSTPSGKTTAHAIATCSFRTSYDNGESTDHATPAVRIFGEQGEIQVYGPIFRPSRTKLIVKKTSSDKAEVTDKTFDFPGDGHGMYWEADEAARCWSAGKLQSEGLTWTESTVIMEVMDEVRKQGGLTYPDAIETTDYPVDLKAKSK
jgi:predicted dehydrogenase